MLNLQDFIFTPGPDEVILFVSSAVPPSSTPYFGIFNDGMVDTLAGDDVILSAMYGELIGGPPAVVAAVANGGSIEMGPGWDLITAVVDVVGGDGADMLGTGLAGTTEFGGTVGRIDTDLENDLVAGFASLEGGDMSFLDARGIDAGWIMTGGGWDAVVGEGSAFAGANSGAAASGIRGAVIETRGGNDVVVGDAVARSDMEATAVGLRDVEVDTDGGFDLVCGTAEAWFNDLNVLGIATGILGSVIETGSHQDRVEGVATLGPGDGGVGYADGIASSAIVTGDAGDTVIGETFAFTAPGGDTTNSNGIRSSVIETERGDDSVFGFVSAAVGDAGVANANDGVDEAEIFTGGGEDLVVGEAELVGGELTDLRFADGFDSALVDTGNGDDRVFGAAIVYGGAGSDLSDSDGFDDTDVFTGDGDDLVRGEADLGGEDLLAGYGDGFFNLDDTNVVDTGAGDDRVFGIGAAIAITNPNGVRPLDQQTSEGFDNYTVRLGDGDDRLIARGASAGLKNAVIEGGDGRDHLDVHSGTGAVNGGDDSDRLLLAGESMDYSFVKLGFREGTISDTGSGGVTDLVVAEIERFTFDDGTFSFADLFG